MLKSTAQFTLMTLIAVAPLAAQGRRGDPTAKVSGSGTLPAGWMVRFDPVNPRFARPGATPPTITDISFVNMGAGFHITSGPAAIYYNPKDMANAKGVYGVSATFHQAKSMVHESYGIFIGGSNLQDSTQNYLYMVIRPMDGSLAIERRSSNAAPTKLFPMAVNDAVNKDSPADGSATNMLMIHVAPDTVHFMVNGKLVKAIAKSELGMSTDGQPGIRVNHNISVHIDGWSVKK